MRDTWRERNPEANRAKNRIGNQRYYGPTRNIRPRNQPYSPQEDDAILAYVVPDKVLALRIRRSVQAIQLRRMRLNRGFR